MAKVHNKKRNIGIIYEQIIKFVCKKIMENDEVTSEKAIKIIKEHFAEGTQLNKEYKLFKALSDTKNVSSPLANSIILSLVNLKASAFLIKVVMSLNNIPFFG